MVFGRGLLFVVGLLALAHARCGCRLAFERALPLLVLPLQVRIDGSLLRILVRLRVLLQLRLGFLWRWRRRHPGGCLAIRSLWRYALAGLLAVRAGFAFGVGGRGSARGGSRQAGLGRLAWSSTCGGLRLAERWRGLGATESWRCRCDRWGRHRALLGRQLDAWVQRHDAGCRGERRGACKRQAERFFAQVVTYFVACHDTIVDVDLVGRGLRSLVLAFIQPRPRPLHVALAADVLHDVVEQTVLEPTHHRLAALAAADVVLARRV